MSKSGDNGAGFGGGNAFGDGDVLRPYQEAVEEAISRVKEAQEWVDTLNSIVKDLTKKQLRESLTSDEKGRLATAKAELATAKAELATAREQLEAAELRAQAAKLDEEAGSYEQRMLAPQQGENVEILDRLRKEKKAEAKQKRDEAKTLENQAQELLRSQQQPTDSPARFICLWDDGESEPVEFERWPTQRELYTSLPVREDHRLAIKQIEASDRRWVSLGRNTSTVLDRNDCYMDESGCYHVQVFKGSTPQNSPSRPTNGVVSPTPLLELGDLLAKMLVFNAETEESLAALTTRLSARKIPEKSYTPIGDGVTQMNGEELGNCLAFVGRDGVMGRIESIVKANVNVWRSRFDANVLKDIVIPVVGDASGTGKSRVSLELDMKTVVCDDTGVLYVSVSTKSYWAPGILRRFEQCIGLDPSGMDVDFSQLLKVLGQFVCKNLSVEYAMIVLLIDEAQGFGSEGQLQEYLAKGGSSCWTDKCCFMHILFGTDLSFIKNAATQSGRSYEFMGLDPLGAKDYLQCLKESGLVNSDADADRDKRLMEYLDAFEDRPRLLQLFLTCMPLCVSDANARVQKMTDNVDISVLCDALGQAEPELLSKSVHAVCRSLPNLSNWFVDTGMLDKMDANVVAGILRYVIMSWPVSLDLVVGKINVGDTEVTLTVSTIVKKGLVSFCVKGGEEGKGDSGIMSMPWVYLHHYLKQKEINVGAITTLPYGTPSRAKFTPDDAEILDMSTFVTRIQLLAQESESQELCLSDVLGLREGDEMDSVVFSGSGFERYFSWNRNRNNADNFMSTVEVLDGRRLRSGLGIACVSKDKSPFGDSWLYMPKAKGIPACLYGGSDVENKREGPLAVLIQSRRYFSSALESSAMGDDYKKAIDITTKHGIPFLYVYITDAQKIDDVPQKQAPQTRIISRCYGFKSFFGSRLVRYREACRVRSGRKEVLDT